MFLEKSQFSRKPLSVKIGTAHCLACTFFLYLLWKLDRHSQISITCRKHSSTDLDSLIGKWEISGFFFVIQILREINVENLEVAKMPFLPF